LGRERPYASDPLPVKPAGGPAAIPTPGKGEAVFSASHFLRLSNYFS